VNRFLAIAKCVVIFDVIVHERGLVKGLDRHRRATDRVAELRDMLGAITRRPLAAG